MSKTDEFWLYAPLVGGLGSMITGLSTISLLLGSAIAYMAGRYPEHRTAMESVGGGLGLMGYALETVLGLP
jgi:L-lactate permease